RERRTEDPRDRHAEEGRRDIRAVVDVLIESRETDTAPDQSDWVDVEEKCGRAAIVRRLRIEDGRLPEGRRKGRQPLGVLVQQVAEVSRRPMGGRDRQQHVVTLRGSIEIKISCRNYALIQLPTTHSSRRYL